MATINLSNLILTMQQKISCTTNEQDLFYYSKVLQQARSGKVFVVISANNLPAASASCGDLYYIQSAENLYVSTGTAWQSILAPGGNCLLSWGVNNCGQQGTGFTNANECGGTFNQEITQSVNWCAKSIRCQTLAVKTNGSLWAWGYNNTGQLGTGNTLTQLTPTREISKSTNWCAVSTGQFHSSAIKTDGTLWAWGSNSCGQLGTNNVVGRSSPVQEITSSTNWCQVKNGQFHTVALKSTGTLWVWGSGVCGGLGNNCGANVSSPVRESGSASNWCSISAGDAKSGGIKTDGTLWNWGIGYCGVLGNNSTLVQGSPIREASSSSNWCQISIGFGGCCWSSHTLAIKTTGTLWGWGNGLTGQLGDNTTTTRSSPVQEVTSATNWCQASGALYQSAAITSDRQFFRWGRLQLFSCICRPCNAVAGNTWSNVFVSVCGGNVFKY